LKQKIILSRTKPHQLIQPKPHWFVLPFILKVKRTKINRILMNIFNLLLQQSARLVRVEENIPTEKITYGIS